MLFPLPGCFSLPASKRRHMVNPNHVSGFRHSSDASRVLSLAPPQGQPPAPAYRLPLPPCRFTQTHSPCLYPIDDPCHCFPEHKDLARFAVRVSSHSRCSAKICGGDGAPGWLSRLSADFRSGHDLTVCEFEPASGSVVMARILEPALDSVSPSLSASPLLALCLSKINKPKKKRFVGGNDGANGGV